MVLFERLLLWAENVDAAQLHVRVGDRPFCRSRRRLVESIEEPISQSQFDELARKILNSEQMLRFDEKRTIDVIYTNDSQRYRANLYRFDQGAGFMLEPLQAELPTIESLKLPSALAECLDLKSGLVLLTGPIGSGKSATLHAVINELNRTEPVSIMSLEENLEHLHQDMAGFVSQLEVGAHIRTFSDGIQVANSLRPDVLCVGNVPNSQAAEELLAAADGGMLVIACLHANRVTSGLRNLIELLPPARRSAGLISLANRLRVCMSQVLVSQYDRSKLPVLEILMNSGGVQSALRRGAFEEIPKLIRMGKGLGMRHLDDSLWELVESATIASDEAVRHAINKSRFESCLGVSG